MNKKVVILLPLMLAIAFAVGMWTQHFLQPKAVVTNKNTSKIDEVLRLITTNYVEDINTDSISDLLLPSLFEKLDPHSSYIPLDEYHDMIDPIRGSFEGIGVQFNIQSDTIVIVQVIPGGPSEKLNIHAGDRIVKVNDSIVAGIGITNEKTIKLLKGPSGTKVKVSIKRNGVKDLIPFEITRGSIPMTSVESAYMIDEKTGYISISCFSQTTHDEFLSAISKLRKKGLKNLIIDLRENGGGLLFAAIDMANEFLSKDDTIVFTKGRREPAEYYTAEGTGTCKDLNLAIIIDEYSASASEILSGAIQDNGRGIIVGRRSYGKGVVNEDFVLRDSSIVRLTTKKFYTPSGRCIQKPYNGKLADYDHELLDRFSHGELYYADSINFPDSLKYTTKNGKIVYGGGGIMPDVFVALDTTKTYSPFLQEMTNKGIIYTYSFSYVDSHRDMLKSKSIEEITALCNTSFSFTALYNLAEKQGVKKRELSTLEQKDVKRLFLCYVVRNVFGDNEFYQLYNADDKTITTAVELLEK